MTKRVAIGLGVLFFLGITAIYLVFHAQSGRDEARQACLDHIAAEAANGTPIPTADCFKQWAEAEAQNLYAEPAIFRYLTTYLHSAAPESDPLLEAAADRLLQGMGECETVSIVPIGQWSLKTDRVFFQGARAIKDLSDHCLQKVANNIEEGDKKTALAQLTHLHEIEAARSPHAAGLLDLTVQILCRQSLFAKTLEWIETGKISPSDAQLARLAMLSTQNRPSDAWGNAMLFERGFAFAVIGEFDNGIDSSHLKSWELHRHFRYDETVYKALLYSWQSLEIAATPPSGKWSINEVEAAALNAEAFVKSKSKHLPNPFLTAEWELMDIQLMGLQSWTVGLARSELSFACYEALIATHRHRFATGRRPKSFDEIADHLFTPGTRAALKSAKAQLSTVYDETVAPRQQVGFTVSDGSRHDFPMIPKSSVEPPTAPSDDQ